MNSSAFSGPNLGDENPSILSITERVPTPSSFKLAIDSAQTKEGVSNKTSIQDQRTTSRSENDQGSSSFTLSSGSFDKSTTNQESFNVDTASISSISAFSQSASFTESSNKADLGVIVENRASSSSDQLNSLLLSRTSQSKVEVCNNTSLLESKHVECFEPAALLSLPQVPVTEYENSPEKNNASLSNLTEESIDSHLSQQLLPSAPSHDVVIFSPLLLSAPAPTSLPLTETMPLDDSTPPQNDIADVPLKEQTRSFESTQLASTFVSPLNSQCSPPSTPRFALAMLPEFDVEPLTSMHNLLSSLSHAHDSEQSLDNGCSGGPDDLPSSSPLERVFRSRTQGSSPPNSSPSRIFSSWPLADRPSFQSADVYSRRSPPPASLDRIISHEQELNNPHLASVEVYENTFGGPRNHEIMLCSSPPAQTSPSPITSVQEKTQETTPSFKLSPKEFPSCNEPSQPISSSDDDLALQNPELDANPAPLPVASSPIPSSSPDSEAYVAVSLSSPPSNGPMAYSSPPRKRKRDIEDELVLPAPKRSTAASQRRQHKKLTTPFKSPLMTRTPKSLDAHPEAPVQSLSTSVDGSAVKMATLAPFSAVNKPTVVESKKQYFTSRAAAQFKSPLSSTEAANLSSSHIRLTPATQALERKIQSLKRALKVKKDNEEEVLTDLTARWTEAGREVAWEVWQLTRNSESGTWGSVLGEKRPFKENWGWEAQRDEKRIKLEDGGCSMTDDPEDAAMSLHDEATVKVEEEEEDRVEYTMGMMLRRLGIDPDTLGWDDQEDAFN